VGDGSDRQRLVDLARGLNVDAYVHFLGRVSDEELKAAYARCSVFVLPSACEGFGLVFVEAMAYGKPVVAARAGATPEVVQDGETGILIDFGDVGQLTAALAKLLSEPESRQRMGAAGLAIVRQKYSYESLKSNLKIVIDHAIPAVVSAAN
jgi:glycosyltransferase involved in cell wall biosynthesis